MPPRLWLAVVLGIGSWPSGLAAQDVEMLGRRYGTRPPDGYFRETARNPEAYRFRRGRSIRLREAAAQGLDARAAPGATGPLGVAGASGAGVAPLGLGPRTGAVVGDVYIPVVLGLFQESPASPFPRATIQSAYFGTQPGTATVSTYYAEVSSDSITLGGDVRDWVRSARSEAATTQGESGLVCCGIGDYIKDVLTRQPALDWGLYDNDGPDGVPNSGDDDGYVDALAVMHPSRGAECDGSNDRIWSHKWSLSDASSGGSPFTTSTPSARGGSIRIDDYFVQGVEACSGGGLNQIGVFVHETGHAFGLPDLYDTRPSLVAHAGAGLWDLMASGTWGCNGNDPARPCHLGAWSKAMLGWVDVTTLAPDTDFGRLTLPPVETTGAVYRVEAGDGSGEHYLLENRQDVASRLFDKNLLSEGLLVWQIDWDFALARWPSNTVNSGSHMGVWLRQADGRDDLGRPGAGRGDAGDPFPGVTGNTQLHAASSPASRSFQGTATGLTALAIARVGNDIELELLTRFTTVTIEAAGTVSGSGGLFTVNGVTLPAPPDNLVVAAPFDARTLVAAAGESLGPGQRRPFVHWTDAPSAPRTRIVATPLSDTTLVAAYAGTEYELAITVTGGVSGVAPGTFTAMPAPVDATSGLWFPPGVTVHVTALPQTGFTFSGWTGSLAGQPNPASLTMSAPVQAGADFQLVYAVADAELDLTATVAVSVLLTPQNGTAPFTWNVLSGSVPEGLTLSPTGLLSGTPLDLGVFPLSVRATDAIGLTGTATLTLEVGPPAIPIGDLASSFLLRGPALDGVEAAFLDHQGNANGAYDLGDFRAWVLANPSLPPSAQLAVVSEPAAIRTIELPVRLEMPPSETPSMPPPDVERARAVRGEDR
jgi:M6 family metalloprotease-like protein